HPPDQRRSAFVDRTAHAPVATTSTPAAAINDKSHRRGSPFDFIAPSATVATTSVADSVGDSPFGNGTKTGSAVACLFAALTSSSSAPQSAANSKSIPGFCRLTTQEHGPTRNAHVS